VTVLALHSRYDSTLRLVQRALGARGASLQMFPTSRFPPAGLSMSPGTASGALALTRGRLSLDDVSAVFYRCDCATLRLPDTMDPEHRRLCFEAVRVSVEGLRAALPVPWLDDPFDVHRADNKPMQLAAARRVGLATPRTLITNRPSDVRAFARSCGGEIIVKMVTSTGWLEVDGDLQRIHTNVVSEKELASLEGLEQSPMIFQERVPKAIELRVTAVGRRFFTASVDSQRAAASQVDWRRDQASIAWTWKPHRLPRTIAARLRALLACFSLRFAAIDMIVTPDGRYVFLELNPFGDYAGLERFLGFPISDAIAELLVPRRARTRATPRGSRAAR
jgi:glutathione synthase/RimK-type ligase-like ATP-grasp enzyme